MRRWSIWIILLIFGISACSDAKSESKGGRRGMKIAPAATVQGLEVVRGAPKVRRDYGGEFVSDSMADLSAEVSGTVREVEPRLGDRVKKGDVLAVIDPISYQQRVRELEASVDLSRASVEEARAMKTNLEAEIARKRPLLARKLVTEREIEDLESQISVSQQRMDVAQATVKQNQARLSLGRDSLQDTRVRAPFDGIIAERYVNLGNHINPGQPLFRVVDDSEVYLRLRVAEHDSGMVTAGMNVTIRVDALGGQELVGTIGRIAPAVDPSTRTLRVDVVPADAGAWARVKPGMYARAQIVIADRADAIAIPTQAVHKERDGTRHVWLVRDGKSVKHPVTPGLRDRDVIEIVDGLEGAETVVVRGHEKLNPDAEVQLVDTSGETQ